MTQDIQEMQNLTETQGLHSPIILVHGWGFSSQVLAPLAAAIHDHPEQTHLAELPGYGMRYNEPSPAHIHEIASLVVQSYPQPCIWLGWSLGGLLALYIAQRWPERVTKLILIGTTPRFSVAPDWPHGTDPNVLENFAGHLAVDRAGTLQRFGHMQLAENPGEKRFYAQLAHHLANEHVANLNTLQSGLGLLRTVDLRSSLTQINAPTLLLHGESDRVVNIGASEVMAETLPNARLVRFPACGHVPFITEKSACVAAILEFLRE